MSDATYIKSYFRDANTMDVNDDDFVSYCITNAAHGIPTEQHEHISVWSKVMRGDRVNQVCLLLPKPGAVK